MTGDTILAMLQCVRDGELRPEEAMERLAKLPRDFGRGRTHRVRAARGRGSTLLVADRY
jgi:hypothetical protein